MQAMVLAVPITAQVPAVVARRPSTVAISSAPLRLRDTSAQNRRQSVQAPRRSPRCRPVDIGPVTSCYAGNAGGDRTHDLGRNGLVAAADQHHGIHGWADHLLRFHRHEVAIDLLVGFRNTSPRDVVGNGMGSAPAASTPRARTASTNSASPGGNC